MADTTVVRGPKEGDAFWMLGGLYELKAGADETGGVASIFEMTLPAGAGPPPHTHAGGETVYVLEGNIKYHIDGKDYEGGPGSCFYIPEGTLENFEPTTRARLLVIYTPGGMEQFFAEAGERARSHELPPPMDGPPDVERLMSIGQKYGLEIRPPEGAPV